MSARRKTIEVEQVRATANAALSAPAYAPSEVDYQAQRMGVITLLESILFATGNYKGFSYLPSELDENGRLLPFYDETRREYF